jgi:predicted Zn-dependent protease
VGWCIVVAGAVVEVARRVRPVVQRRALAAAFLLVVALGAWRTWIRNPVWDSSDTVLSDLAEHHPESFRAEWYMGARLAREDSATKSLFYYRWAVARVGPHYPLLYSYGAALLRFRQYQAAIPILRRVVDHVPQHRDSQLLLGSALAKLGRWQEAHDAVEAAIRVLPDDAELYSLLAVTDAQLGDWPAALKARLASLKYSGDKAKSGDWLHLALIRARLGDTAQARYAFARARVLARESGDSLGVPSLDSLLALPHGLGIGRIVIP